MARRKKLKKQQSKKMFKRAAQATPKINYRAAPMRGGIRL